MEAISAIGIFTACVYAFMLIGKKNHTISDKILICWMVLFAVHLILPLMMARGNRFFIEEVDGVDIGLYTLHVTVLFYYTLSLTQQSFKLRPAHLLYLIPTATLYIVQKSIDANTTYFSSFINRYLWRNNEMFHLISVVSLNLIFCLFFCIKSFRILRNHKINIENNLSFSENVNLKWVRNLIIAAVVLTVIVFIYLIALLTGKLNHEWLNNFYFSSISLFVVVLGYWGYKQKQVFTYMEIPEKKSTQASVSKNLKHTEQKDIKSSPEENETIKALRQLMDNERPFLDPELNIGVLANRLGVHSHQLSKLINNKLNQNFFEFVNGYRIEEFKLLVSDPKNSKYSILGLALDSGFNSKASFNRIFKNSTGKTPSQFRKNLKF